MVPVTKQELYLWPPDLAWRSLMIILYYPVRTALHIFRNLAFKFAAFRTVLDSNKPVTIGPVWDLLVWCFIALLAVVLPLIILKDTISDAAALNRPEKKTQPIIVLAVICGKLVSYYVLAAIFLFVLFNYFVPEKLLFQHLGQ